ncbi:MAG TPA: hypothetical protein DER55_01330 [Bacteroides uniformis]|uniref:Uncharacterized protein n=1 Tax=Bacteroides uniformis TaxID=820 RepID=A0A414JM85_BACUN|nr:hypothetical protein GAS26_14695 [Bacteroides uniformis]RJV03429.1 hypothetical protein DWZ67_16960 [Bacteroides sp. AF34-31BH]RJW93882.1 hypothetical protein DWZ80_05095 [Bacteroides sp. AF35-22]KAB3918194.1 hypothetical protein GAS31_13950 [Bacteroides uniformis]KAB3918666.1 hypothetical protein GAS08_07445 [Bacteroides uniformis]
MSSFFFFIKTYLWDSFFLGKTNIGTCFFLPKKQCFFLASLLARFCLPIGKALPPRWQNFAIGMAKVCQGQGKWLAKFLADRQ